MVDPRQILAGFLTLTMFAMLANMIKREHLDSHVQVKLSESEDIHSRKFKLAKSFSNNKLWLEDDQQLKPCWTKPTSARAGSLGCLSFLPNKFVTASCLEEEGPQSDGYVTFSLTRGPEYHISQIADAVVVARNLGATLVLPDIRQSKLGEKRNFDDVYDAQKFVQSLEGVIKVVKQPPLLLSPKNLGVVKVPNRVTDNHVTAYVEPIYREKGNVRLKTYFPSVNMKTTENENHESSSSRSVSCLAMFGTLELQPEIRDVVDSMVERLRTLSKKSDGRFIAVDLKVDVLEKKGCKIHSESEPKSCYNAKEVADFLKKLGFDKDTAVYVTQSRWDSSLDALKEYYPKTYTKEAIMPVDYKDKFLNQEAPTMEEVIDFYMCSQSDVFVPAISGLFYANVAGKRITSGKTEILVPADIPGKPASVGDYISHYVTQKNHLAFSCFCGA